MLLTASFPRPPSTMSRARPPSAAGMDNQVKIWGLQPYAHVVAASEEWVPGGPRVFPTSHVTMPLFSSEVGESLWKPRACTFAAAPSIVNGCRGLRRASAGWQRGCRSGARSTAAVHRNPPCSPAAALELRGLCALAGRLCAEQVGGQHAGGALLLPLLLVVVVMMLGCNAPVACFRSSLVVQP